MELSRPLSTVTPTLDGDVLAALARTDLTFTLGQLHRILPRHSEEGIRKVLRRLVRQGVVCSDRVGKTFTYRLNRDHIAADYVIGLANLQGKLLQRVEDRLTSWRQSPVYAAMFGSAARGSMTVDSDIDLLLVLPDDVDETSWDTDVENLISDVTRWTGNDTRALQFGAAEIAAHGLDEPVLRAVQKEGLTVAGTHSWLNGQLSGK
jgi:predicted nucleotidyltransferase